MSPAQPADDTANGNTTPIDTLTDGVDEATAGSTDLDPGERITTRTVYRWGVAAGLGLLTVYLTVRAFVLVQDVMVQILIAAFIAVSLDPPVRWMVRRGLRRSHAVTIIFLATLLVIAGFLLLLIPPMIGQATKLTSDFPGYITQLRQHSPTLTALEDHFHLQNKINDLARTLPGQLGHQALTFGRRFFGALVSMLLVIVLTIYIMADLPRLRTLLVRLFPLRHRPRVSQAINVVIDKVGSYMIGNIIISLIAGATAFVAFMLLHVSFALPLAIMIAIADLIPLVGATIGAVISVVVAVATTDLVSAIVLAGFFVLYQQAENYYIAPRVLRGSVDMPSLAVLLAALLGASAMGVIGALMAIPIAAAIKVLVTPVMRARDETEIDVTRTGRLRLLRKRVLTPGGTAGGSPRPVSRVSRRRRGVPALPEQPEPGTADS